MTTPLAHDNDTKVRGSVTRSLRSPTESGVYRDNLDVSGTAHG